MIYRGPGFLAVICLAPPLPPSKRGRRHTGRIRERDNLLTRWGGLGWVRTRNIRPQESLVLYESLSTLCVYMRFLNACDFFDEVVKATSAREHDVLLLTAYC
jgi:hypothetical protein